MNAQTLIGHFRQYPILFICGFLSVGILAATYIRGMGLSETRDRLEQVARDGARMDDNVKNAVDLEAHLEAIREMTGEVSSRLVQPSELARNLQYFYRLESESGVTIRSLDQRGTPSRGGEDEEVPVYVPLRYDIAIEGTYADLLDFVYRLENGRHFARFTQFEIIRGQQGGSTVLQMAMNLELLAQP